MPIGVVVAKMEPHKSTGALRGYIGMLVVTKPYRGLGLGDFQNPWRYPVITHLEY